MGFGSRGTKAHMAQLEARAGAISPKSSSLGEGRTRRRSEVRLHLAPQATGALPGRDLGRPRLGARAAAATTFKTTDASKNDTFSLGVNATRSSSAYDSYDLLDENMLHHLLFKNTYLEVHKTANSGRARSVGAKAARRTAAEHED